MFNYENKKYIILLLVATSSVFEGSSERISLDPEAFLDEEARLRDFNEEVDEASFIKTTLQQLNGLPRLYDGHKSLHVEMFLEFLKIFPFIAEKNNKLKDPRIIKKLVEELPISKIDGDYGRIEHDRVNGQTIRCECPIQKAMSYIETYLNENKDKKIEKLLCGLFGVLYEAKLELDSFGDAQKEEIFSKYRQQLGDLVVRHIQNLQ